MNKKLLTITVHVAAWTCFFLLPIVFYPRPRDPNFQMSQAMINMYICINIFLVAFYYTNTDYFIPKLLTQKKWLWYTLAIIVCFTLFVQIPGLFRDAIRAGLPQEVREKMLHRKKAIIPYPFTGTTAVFFLVFTVSTCMKVIQQWLNTEKRSQEMENEKLVTELSFLKSQINPHFLFNTLNNIYSLAVVKSDATAGAVLKLSSIMRYVMNETKQNLVSLDKEIKFLNDYLELQKVRLTDKVKVTFEINGDVDQKQIAPLILIPFVENAFKYGISTKHNSEILIKLDVTNEAVNFFISNAIVAIEREKIENNGIGLTNSRRRLELLYPGTHDLKVVEENKIFTVQLKLWA